MGDGLHGTTEAAATAVKSIVEGTSGRGDATYVTVIVLVICGIASLAIIGGLCVWLPRFLSRMLDNYAQGQQSLVDTFRAEMSLERDFHERQVTRLTDSFDRLADTVAGNMPRRRKKPSTITEVMPESNGEHGEGDAS